MPGSLLARSRVARHESTRSDRSDVSAYSNNSQNSGKKVSFNKAVRVKKYPRQKKTSGGIANGDTPNGSLVNGGSPSPEKRFWFKVYKNKHRQAPDPSEFRNEIHYGPAENGFDDVSYDPNPSSSVIIHTPVLTTECGTQTPGRKGTNGHDSATFRNESTPLHPSQMPTDPPHVRKNHVKKIVNRFNEEAVLKRQKSSEGETSPLSSPSTPRRHVIQERVHEIPPPPPPPPPQPSGHSPEQRQSPDGQSASKSKKNPIVNGVKVIFGMAQLKRRDKSNGIHDKNMENIRRSHETSTRDMYIPNGDVHHSRKAPYKTEIVISDGSETEVKTPERRYLTHKGNRERKWSGGKINSYDPANAGRNGGGQLVRSEIDDDYDYREEDEEDEDFFGRERHRGKVHVETWDSGDQLIFDTTDINASSERTSEGQFLKTVGEKHQLWRNDRRTIVYEEPSPRPSRRKAKSQNDLTDPDRDDYYLTQEKMDKGVSTEQLFSRKEEKREVTVNKPKDSWLKQWRSNTKDKGVQCNKVPTVREDEEYLNGKYRVIRSKNGMVSAYSDVPSLDKNHHHHKTTADENKNSFLEMRNGAIYSQVDKSKKKKTGTKERKKKDSVIDEKPVGLFKSRSEPLYIGPPPKSSQQEEVHEQSIFFEEKPEKKVKSSKRSFGFRLKTNRDRVESRDDFHSGRGNGRAPYREENWYDVDDEVEAVEMQKRRGPGHHDIAEVRQELAAEEEGVSDISSLNGDRARNGDVVAGSVMREVDFKKREISYENVPRPEGDFAAPAGAAAGSGLWHRDAEEDYRREMAQSEVSYPAGSHVGSERFYTLGRTEKGGKRDVSPGPRAYTLDRRHLKEKEKVPNTSGVKILVNGKEVDESASGGTMKKSKGHRKGRTVNEDPSSVQSDPLYVRGGLAAAYQARQRAAVRRSNSSAAGMTGGYRSASKRSPALDRRGQDHGVGSSAASAASSESDSTRQRRPLVMYIPGISHPERSADEGDRSSGVNVARSQSMMTSSRPPRIIPRRNKGQKNNSANRSSNNIYEEDEIMPLASDSKRKSRASGDSKKQSDIRRRHSMPKDTKFSWLKWRIKGKPSREP